MQNNQYDIAIVGGGIVGLATAYKLQLNFPYLDIVVFEKEAELAFHQTGRNSGVLHSGLYYKPGSLRAENCVKGRKQLVQFAKENDIDFDICGKIVLAVNIAEVERLKQLKINEVEFTLHSQRSYLKKLQKIYFDTDDIDSFENTRINLIDFEKKELRNIYMISSN